MTTEEKIRNDIRVGVRRHRGALTEISKKTGYTREFVRLVLRGKRNNVHVLSISAEVVKERETMRSGLLNAAKSDMEAVASMAVL